MKLPERKNLIMTNDEDPLNFYYYPLIGLVYRKRLANSLRLLGDKKFDQLLDIGFGSGILFRELGERATQTHGIEVHDKVEAVATALAAEGLHPALHHAGIEAIPYQDQFFDAVISISTMEHLDNLDAALREVKRVLKAGGVLVLSFPVRNAITDAFYRLFGFKPRDIHPNSHADIIAAAQKHFRLSKKKKFPPLLPDNLALYLSCRFVRE